MRPGVLANGRRCCLGQLDACGRTAPAECDYLPVRQRSFGDRLSVEQRAVAAAFIPDDPGTVARRDSRVHARDALVGVAEADVAIPASADDQTGWRNLELR